MEKQLEDIRDQQKQSWNKFSGGWKKWNDLNMNFIKPMGDEIIRLIEPKPLEKILDIASGTGEPGLTIAASMNNSGKVILTDLAESMLDIAKESAIARGITNVETQVCDVCDLPFEDESFDAVSCRFGFMFFPDMQLAANEIARVLKPGGRVATSVWNGPQKNFWVMAIMGTLNRNLDLPAPPKGAPGMFRCSEPGLVTDLFKLAGLINISTQEIAGSLKAGTAENYWSMMTEVGAPIVAALSKATDEQKSTIKKEVFELINEKFAPGLVEIESSANIIYAEKK